MVNVVEMDKMKSIVLKVMNFILVQSMKQMVQLKYGILLKVKLQVLNLQ